MIRASEAKRLTEQYIAKEINNFCDKIECSIIESSKNKINEIIVDIPNSIDNSKISEILRDNGFFIMFVGDKKINIQW